MREFNFRLANVQLANGRLGIAIDTDNGILDVTSTAKNLNVEAPEDVDELIQENKWAQLSQMLDATRRMPNVSTYIPPDEVSFMPLVTRPEKIVCVGFNYRQHAEETNTPMPKEPPLFPKYRNTLNHHGGKVELPTHVDYQFDYETELVIVIGRKCSNLTEAEALEYVAGYTIGNDLSARMQQTVTSQFTAGKNFDGFAPLGPWLVPRSMIKDPNDLWLNTFVNGQKRQDWTTKDMIFDCKKLIAYASQCMTLRPGDVLFTGTPQGVVFGEKAPPEQRGWLKDGDVVESRIEKLGSLQISLTAQSKLKPLAVPRVGLSSLLASAKVDGLTILNGGEAQVEDVSVWSPGHNVGKPSTFSCNAYLIKHGDDYMLWDAGISDELASLPDGKVVAHGVKGLVGKTIRSQFEQLGIHADQVTHIAFSHAHFDHVGNSRDFRKAKWLVQEREYKAMFGPSPEEYGFVTELYEMMRENIVIIVGETYDVFGDGSVVLLSTPGHTPGHQSCIVRLRNRGTVVLSGDVAHFRDNFCCRRVPKFNADHDASKASMDKIDEIVKQQGAELWINHDVEQSAMLPYAPHWIG